MIFDNYHKIAQDQLSNSNAVFGSSNEKLSKYLVKFLTEDYNQNHPNRILEKKLRESDYSFVGSMSTILDDSWQAIKVEPKQFLLFTKEIVNKEAFKPQTGDQSFARSVRR